MAFKYSYKVPTVWVDTNVIIDMARGEENTLSEDPALKRGKELYDLLYKLSTKKKIIYLDAQQRSEYGNNPKLLEKIDEMQIQLSKGVKVNHEGIIKQHQVEAMMRVVCNLQSEYKLNDSDIFSEDPLEEISRSEKIGLIISFRPKINEWEREMNTKIRDKTKNDWESLRKVKIRDGMTFKEALDLEYTGDWHAIDATLRKKSASFGDDYTLRSIDWWRNISGKEDLDSLREFMYSDEYKKIPCVDINSKLLASFVTCETDIKKGDPGDSEQLSMILPYCDLVITDKIMKHKLKYFKFDEEYGVKIFALKDFNEIKTQLERL